MKRILPAALLIFSLGLTAGWLGAPWRLHDEGVCSDFIPKKGQIHIDSCGSRAFYHQSMHDYMQNAQSHLIRTVVGNRPVVMNITIKNPNLCDTGLTIGKTLNNVIFANDDFIGHENPKACPVFEAAENAWKIKK